MKPSKIFWLSLLVCGVVCLVVLNPQLALTIYLGMSTLHFIFSLFRFFDDDSSMWWIEFIFPTTWFLLILLGIGYIFGFIVDSVLYFNKWLDESFKSKNNK